MGIIELILLHIRFIRFDQLFDYDWKKTDLILAFSLQNRPCCFQLRCRRNSSNTFITTI